MVNPIVRQIVNREHVSATNRMVIRAVVERLKWGYESFIAMPRRERRKLMKDAIAVHRANRDIYRMVMGR